MNRSQHYYSNLCYSTKLFLLFLILFISTIGFAQVQTQKGVSYRYNGKNPRTPLPNVTIECITANNTVISDSTGSFTLTFNKLKMGDRMGLVTVKKREMLVFNQHAVDEWSIRKEPLCLILCDANEFENQKQNLIAIGRREAQKKYDRQKAELQKQLDASEIDRAKYEIELDKAYEELDRLHKHLDEYADLFARIDESEIDSTAQQAIELFNQGQVDETVRLFEQGNYLEKLKASNRAIQQADNMIETAEAVKAKVEKDKEEQLQSLKAQVAAYKMQNEWEKAGDLLKGIADEINTFDALIEYANFSNRQNHFEQAESYYQKADMVLESNDNNFEEYKLKKSMLLSKLAGIYKATQRFNESETAYISAISNYDYLLRITPSSYELRYAQTLNQLGNLYYDWNRFDDCETKCLTALSICKKHQGNHKTEEYYYTLAEISNMLGLLYDRTQRFEESETMYLSAIDYFEYLDSINPSTYQYLVGKSFLNIAALYDITHRYDDGERYCLLAQATFERAVETNPDAYLQYLAIVQLQLAKLYNTTQRLEESEKKYYSSLKIFEQLADICPLVYLPFVAGVKQNIGGLYEKTQRIEKGLAMDLDALHIFEHLAESNPSTYKPKVADLMMNTAISYMKIMRYEESEAMFLSALEINKDLAKTIPSVYMPNLQIIYENLGVFYLKRGLFEQSETMLLSSLEVSEFLASTNPTVYDPIVARTKLNLGTIYEYTQRYDESETMISSAVQIYKKYAQSNSSVFMPSLAEAYHALAVLYYYIQEYDKSADMYSSELEIFEAFAITNPSKYDYYVAATLYSIGLLRLVQEHYVEGIDPLNRAIEIYKRWMPQNPSLQRDYFGATHWIGHMYAGLKDYISAYNALNEWMLWAKESQWDVPEFDIEEFGNVSKFANNAGKFTEAEQWALEGLKLDSTQNTFYFNLAAALLFQGKYAEAEAIYRRYKDELKDNFLQDLQDFEAAGVIPEERKEDVERIRKMLNE